MKVCPRCKRIYEDTKQTCPHDNTPLQAQPAAAGQANPQQTEPPKLASISHLAREAEERRLKRQRNMLGGFGVIAALLLLLWLGGSPWLGVNSPSSEPSAETAVAMNEQPASPKAQPEPEKATTAEGLGSAPKPELEAAAEEVAPPPAQRATAEEAATEPEQEEATVEPRPTLEPEKSVVERKAVTQPARTPAAEEAAAKAEQRATARQSTLKAEPENPLSTQESVRVAGQGRKNPSSMPVEQQQAQPAPTMQQPPAATEESAPMAERRAPTPQSTIRAEPEEPVSAQESVDVAGQEEESPVSAQESVDVADQEKESPDRMREEGQQAQPAPTTQKPRMQARAERPRASMTWIYQTKTATPLLSRARSGAPVVKQLGSGEQLRVVGWVGDYLEVRSSGQGTSVYVHPKDVTLVRIE